MHSDSGKLAGRIVDNPLLAKSGIFIHKTCTR